VALEIVGELKQRAVPQMLQHLLLLQLLLLMLLLLLLLLLQVMMLLMMMVRILMLVGRAARGFAAIDQIAIVFGQIQ